MVDFTLPKGTAYKEGEDTDLRKQVDRAKLWYARINQARTMLDIEKRKERVDELSRYLDGTYQSNTPDKVYLNEALPAVEDVIHATLPDIPPVEVEARQPEQEQLARVVSSLCDSTMTSGLSQIFDSVIAMEWDEGGWGVAFGKLTWCEEWKRESYRPTADTDYLAPHVVKAQDENQDPEMAEIAENDDDPVHIQMHNEAAVLFAPDSPELKAIEKHIANHYARIGRRKWGFPVHERVDPSRFMYDPHCERWSDRRWETEECDALVSELQEVPGIKHLDPVNCPPIDEFGDGMEAPVAEDYENKRVRVYKVHDRVNDRYIILPFEEGSDTKPLLETEWPYGSMEIYDAVVHRPIRGRVHGISTYEVILPIVEELARTNAAIRRHNRRAALAKMITPRGTMDKRGVNDVAGDQLFAEVPPEAMAGMKEFKPPTVPEELLMYRETLLSELRRMLGSDIMAQGGSNPHQISASEAQLKGGYREERLARRQREISRHLAWCARNIVLMFRDFSDESIPVRVMGQMGMEVHKLDPTAIPEDLIVKLDITASTPVRMQTEMAREKDWIGLVTTVAPGAFDPITLLLDYASKMGKRNAGKVFAMPNPMIQSEPVSPNAEEGNLPVTPTNPALRALPFPQVPGAQAQNPTEMPQAI